MPMTNALHVTQAAKAAAAAREGDLPVAGQPLLEAVELTKSFGAVQALRGASLTCRAGEVTALVGDNGAGKSTLIKCLTGVHRPDTGTMRFGEREVEIGTPEVARALGIETVYQDLALVEDLTVWQNLFLARELRRGIRPLRFLDKKAMIRFAETKLQDLEVNIPTVRASVRRMSGGQRQAIAIGRAVTWGSSLLVMDEPTAALGVRETHAVEELIGRLRRDGMSVLLISHDLAQVMRVADQVWVLRQGRVIGGRRTAETDGQEIVAMITGVSEDPRSDEASA
jgi:D-xylose transport system ATP-binding protein